MPKLTSSKKQVAETDTGKKFTIVLQSSPVLLKRSDNNNNLQLKTTKTTTTKKNDQNKPKQLVKPPASTTIREVKVVKEIVTTRAAPNTQDDTASKRKPVYKETTPTAAQNVTKQVILKQKTGQQKVSAKGSTSRGENDTQRPIRHIAQCKATLEPSNMNMNLGDRSKSTASAFSQPKSQLGPRTQTSAADLRNAHGRKTVPELSSKQMEKELERMYAGLPKAVAGINIPNHQGHSEFCSCKAKGHHY